MGATCLPFRTRHSFIIHHDSPIDSFVITLGQLQVRLGPGDSKNLTWLDPSHRCSHLGDYPEGGEVLSLNPKASGMLVSLQGSYPHSSLCASWVHQCLWNTSYISGPGQVIEQCPVLP